MSNYEKLLKIDRKAVKTKAERRKLYQQKEWYNIRALMGNQWAFFYILLRSA